MRKIWKELVILCGFIVIFCLLLLEHVQHMNGVIIQELPYIILIIETIVFMLWGVEKIKQYQISIQANDKLSRLANQYDLNYDEKKSTIYNSDHMLDEINQLLKKNEFNISTFEYRYRLLADLTKQTIFEYNLKNNAFCDSNDWKALTDGNRFIDDNITKGIIHPDDANIFKSFFKDVHDSGQLHEVQVRVRYHKASAYQQTSIRGVVLSGIDGNPEKIVGTHTILPK